MALIRRKMSNNDYYQIKMFLETEENENFDYDLSSFASADFLEEVQLYCISVPKDKKDKILNFLNSKKSDRGVAKILNQLAVAASKRQPQTQPTPQTQIASQPTPQSAPVDEKDERETKEEREAKIKEILADL